MPSETRSLTRRNTFIEVGSFLKRKAGQNADGDVFLSKKNITGGRIVTALSDGLGSGIKANVLASLTATMLIEFVLKDIPPSRAAELIINSLPVCRDRGLSYAAFTLVDVRPDMSVHFTEYGNPPLVIVRDGRLIEPGKTKIPLKRRNKNTGPNDEALLYSTYDARPGDRIVFFSDGVTQAGIGTEHYGDGWGIERVRSFALFELEHRPTVSARNLAETIVQAASQTDGNKPHDDISCGVVYFREPRDLLVVTGPPFREEDDREVARTFAAFPGPKVILGGTTAKIISRELGATLRDSPDYTESPAVSLMDGADLVCEGVLTLDATAALLAGTTASWQNQPDSFSRAASRFAAYLLDSDRVRFIVGTKPNEAHFDPSIPVEIENRRSLVKRIAALLEEKHMKQTIVRYI
jgi:hypothetical protein